MDRPSPPRELFEAGSGVDFIPAPDLTEWARATFIDEDATLPNEEHSHLAHASIGFCWTTVVNSRGGHRIVGQCEIMPPAVMGKWARARAIQQIEEWFGALPDFLITLDANYAAEIDDIVFCALVEHELYHAGQDRDPYGAPKFRRDGRPAFAIYGHDVQEFVGVVRRYGAGAAAGATAALVKAANQRPEVGATQISQACGTCRLLRAA